MPMPPNMPNKLLSGMPGPGQQFQRLPSGEIRPTGQAQGPPGLPPFGMPPYGGQNFG